MIASVVRPTGWRLSFAATARTTKVPFSARISSPPTIRLANSPVVTPLATTLGEGLLSTDPEVRLTVSGTLRPRLRVVRPDLSYEEQQDSDTTRQTRMFVRRPMVNALDRQNCWLRRCSFVFCLLNFPCFATAQRRWLTTAPSIQAIDCLIRNDSLAIG